MMMGREIKAETMGRSLGLHPLLNPLPSRSLAREEWLTSTMRKDRGNEAWNGAKREREKGRAGVVVVVAAALVSHPPPERRCFFSLSSLSFSLLVFSFSFSSTHSLLARMPAVTVVPLLPPQPTSMTLLFVLNEFCFLGKRLSFSSSSLASSALLNGRLWR